MPRFSRALGAVICGLSLGCVHVIAPHGPGVLVQRVMHSNGRAYPFVVFAPTSYEPRSALPAVLLVHGAGGNGEDFVETWRTFAEEKRIILVAPTLDLSAASESQVPVIFPRLMEEVSKEWNVDPARRYLFGYSAGGYFVYDAALLNADYFAGAGVFASVIQPEYDSIVSQARGTTRIAIYLGDRDPYFSLQQGRRTRDLLQANGIAVRYVEMSNQDHNYAAVAGAVNEDLWQFLAYGRPNTTRNVVDAHFGTYFRSDR